MNDTTEWKAELTKWIEECVRLRFRKAELLTTLDAIAMITVNPAVPEAYETAFDVCQRHARKALDEERQT